MKIECTDCQHYNNNICTKNAKNGYKNCKKFKQIPMDHLIKEQKQLLISKEDPERLKILTEKIISFQGY